LGKIARVLQTTLLLVLGISTALPLLASQLSEDELVSLARSGRKVVIADFGMGYCRQCKTQAATLDEIRETYGDKVIVRMVNVGKETGLTKRYEVEWIPTLVFIDPGGKVVLKKVGPLAYEEIAAQLSRMGVE
jgi:thioredoxin-like negative regulator of GroEL